jgi:hypothetical protein
MLLRADNRLGQIQVGSDILPGVLQSISVGGAIIYEKSGAEKSQEKKKVLSGWDDKTISIELVLIPDTEDDDNDEKMIIDLQNQVTSLEYYFSNTENQLPIIYEVTNPLITARNIEKMLFKSLNTSFSTGAMKIMASLEFVEFQPAKYDVVDKDQQSLETTASKSKLEKDKDGFLDGFTDGDNASFDKLSGTK